MPMNIAFAIAAAALLAALAGCASAPPPASAPAAAAVPAISVPLHTPRPGVYTAGQPAASDWPLLAAHGVGTVINLRTPQEMQDRDEAAEVRAAGMRYQEIAVDGMAGITLDNARRLSALLREADGPVLLHCASANRSGALLAVAAALDGMPKEEALALGRAASMTSTEKRVRELLELPAE